MTTDDEPTEGAPTEADGMDELPSLLLELHQEQAWDDIVTLAEPIQSRALSGDIAFAAKSLPLLRTAAQKTGEVLLAQQSMHLLAIARFQARDPSYEESFRDALALLPTRDRNRAKILADWARCCRMDGRLSDALNCLTEAEALYRKSGDDINILRLQAQIGIIRLRLGDEIGGAAAVLHSVSALVSGGEIGKATALVVDALTPEIISSVPVFAADLIRCFPVPFAEDEWLEIIMRAIDAGAAVPGGLTLDYLSEWPELRDAIGAALRDRPDPSTMTEAEVASASLARACEQYEQEPSGEAWMVVAHLVHANSNQWSALPEHLAAAAEAIIRSVPEDIDPHDAVATSEELLSRLARRKRDGNPTEYLSAAIRHARNATRIRQSEGSSRERISALVTLSNAFYDASVFDSKHIDRAITVLKLARRICAADRERDEWGFINANLGNLYMERYANNSDIESAIAHLASALRAAPIIEDRYTHALVLRNLGSAFFRRATGDRHVNLRESISYLHQASVEFEALGMDVECGVAKHALALATADVDDHDSAARAMSLLLTEALPLLKASPIHWAGAADDLADLMWRCDAPVAPRMALRRRVIDELYAAGADRDLSIALKNLAVDLGAQVSEIIDKGQREGLIAEAEQAFHDALGCPHAAYDTGWRATLLCSRGGARVRWMATDSSHLRGAMSDLSEAATLLSDDSSPQQLIPILEALGDLRSATGSWVEAARAYGAALAQYESIYGSALDLRSRIDILDGATACSESFAYCAALQNDCDAAILQLELWRGRILSRTGAVSTGEDPTDPVTAKAGDAALRALRAFMQGSERAPELLDEMERQSRSRWSETGASTLADIRDSLDVIVARQPLIVVLSCERGSMLITISRGSVERLEYGVSVLPVTAREVWMAARQLHEMAAGEASVDSDPHAWQVLSVAIRDEAARLGVSSVALLPIGPSAFLPLHVDESQHHRAPLSATFLPGVRFGAELLTRETIRGELGYLPVLGTLPGLPYATAEVETGMDLATRFGLPVERTVRTADGVLQRLAALEHSVVLHVGCHGKSNPNDPLRAHLDLGGDHLTAGQILEAKQGLSNVRVAILSACESGIPSHMMLSVEPLSLATSTLIAGASAAVGTLWRVHDFAASVIVSRFLESWFEGLAAGASSQELGPIALAEAQAWASRCCGRNLYRWLVKHPVLHDALRRQQPDAWDYLRRGPEGTPLGDWRLWAAFVYMGG